MQDGRLLVHLLLLFEQLALVVGRPFTLLGISCSITSFRSLLIVIIFISYDRLRDHLAGILSIVPRQDQAGPKIAAIVLVTEQCLLLALLFSHHLTALVFSTSVGCDDC